MHCVELACRRPGLARFSEVPSILLVVVEPDKFAGPLHHYLIAYRFLPLVNQPNESADNLVVPT